MLVAGAWSVPAVALATAMPLAAASTQLTAVDLTSTTESFTSPRLALTRPSGFRLSGQMAAGMLVHVSLSPTFTPVGGGATHTMPWAMNGVNAPNFNLIDNQTAGNGTQTLTFRVNRELTLGLYTKSLQWEPLAGMTKPQLEAHLLTWPAGQYTAVATITAGGFVGPSATITLTIAPE